MKADDIHLALEMGDGLRGALYEIEKDGYLFEVQKQLSELTDYIVRLSNNTRMRENNGFTPSELSKIEQEKHNEIKKNVPVEMILVIVEVGRNIKSAA